jgi:hypothetical protein
MFSSAYPYNTSDAVMSSCTSFYLISGSIVVETPVRIASYVLLLQIMISRFAGVRFVSFTAKQRENTSLTAANLQTLPWQTRTKFSKFEIKFSYYYQKFWTGLTKV